MLKHSSTSELRCRYILPVSTEYKCETGSVIDVMEMECRRDAEENERGS